MPMQRLCGLGLILTVLFLLCGCAGEAEIIYVENCAGCHDTGKSNTPTRVDIAYWEQRSSIPFEARLAKTIQGDDTGKWGIQPPRGGNPKLSDQQVRIAMEWLLINIERP